MGIKNNGDRFLSQSPLIKVVGWIVSLRRCGGE